jgi:hypothetical protein
MKIMKREKVLIGWSLPRMAETLRINGLVFMIFCLAATIGVRVGGITLFIVGEDVGQDCGLDVGGVHGLERVGSGSVGARRLGFVEKSEVHWSFGLGLNFLWVWN